MINEIRSQVNILIKEVRLTTDAEVNPQFDVNLRILEMKALDHFVSQLEKYKNPTAELGENYAGTANVLSTAIWDALPLQLTTNISKPIPIDVRVMKSVQSLGEIEIVEGIEELERIEAYVLGAYLESARETVHAKSRAIRCNMGLWLEESLPLHKVVLRGRRLLSLLSEMENFNKDGHNAK